MDVRRDLGVLVDELKISAGPSRAKAHDFGWSTVVVALLRWERWVLAIEGAWQIRAVDAEAFLRHIDCYFGIHLQEVHQSTHVIAVPMGHNDEIQLREVDIFCFGVLG